MTRTGGHLTASVFGARVFRYWVDTIPALLKTVARLHTAGEPVTFARVARTANVSTWFTYDNTDVATAIRDA